MLTRIIEFALTQRLAVILTTLVLIGAGAVAQAVADRRLS